MKKRQSLQEVVLGKIGQLRVKIEIRAFLHIIYKKNSKLIKDKNLNYKTSRRKQMENTVCHKL